MGNLLHSIKRELSFAARQVFRGDYLCQRYLRELRENERLSREELERRNRKHLQRTLQEACRRLLFYSEVSRNFGESSVVQVLLDRFPIITKEVFRLEPQRLYPHSGKRRLLTIRGESGGTTGTPLEVVRSLKSVVIEKSFIRRHWSWFGLAPGIRWASFRGELVVSRETTKPPYWYYNRYDNQLVFSSLHLSDRTAESYVAQLLKFSPILIVAYPSVAYKLASYLKEMNRRLDIPFVITSAEPLYSHQRELLQQRLATKVVDYYGMAERVVFATECEHGNLHVNTDYSHVEIVDDAGAPTDDYGYIVGTTYHNLLMPLVRYKLSDRTKWKPGACECGRPFPMIEPVAGRVEDAVYGSRGNDIGPLLYRTLNGVSGIQESQIAQIDNGRFEIRVVPGPGYSGAVANQMIRNVRDYVDSGIEVDVICVPRIAKTVRGKHQWIVNEFMNGAREDHLGVE